MILWGRAVSNFLHRRRFWICAILVFLLGLAGASLLDKFFHVQVARQDFDEGPTIAAYILKYPERYVRDIFAYNSNASAMGSVQNWLPALAFKYLNIAPEAIHLVWVVLQNVLIGLSVFYFAWAATAPLSVAWLSALAALTLRPWTWNLAIYGELLWMPYAGHLAAPLLIFGLAELLRGRWRASLLFLILTGWAHPSMGFYASAFWGIFLLFDRKAPLFSSVFLRQVGSLVAAAILSATPTLLVLAQYDFVKNAPETKSLLLGNGHVRPWLVGCEWCNVTFIRNLFLVGGIMASALLAFRRLRHTLPRYFRLWLAVVTTALSLTILHVVNVLLEGNVSILKLLLPRSSLFIGFVSLPILFWALYREWPRAHFLSRWLCLGTLCVLCYQTPYAEPLLLLAFTVAAVSFVEWRARQKKLSPILTTLCTIITISVLIIFYRRVDHLNFVRIDGIKIPFNLLSTKILIRGFGWSALCTLGTWLLMQRSRNARPLFLILPLTAFMSISYFKKSNEIGMTAQDPVVRSNFELQRWARENTPPHTLFIHDFSLSNSFRAYSMRGAINHGLVQSPYSYTERAKEYNGRMRDFLNKYNDAGRGETLPGYWTKFVAEFGGNYLIRRKDKSSPLPFKTVFTNNKFVVYEIVAP